VEEFLCILEKGSLNYISTKKKSAFLNMWAEAGNVNRPGETKWAGPVGLRGDAGGLTGGSQPSVAFKTPNRYGDDSRRIRGQIDGCRSSLSTNRTDGALTLMAA
jgi:hypothetical protein